MNRVLILSCSQRKKATSGLLPAVERYDGPTYQVLRKFQKTNLDNNLRIIILSGKYEILFPETAIPDYDFKMTPERAAEIKASVQKDLYQCFFFYDIAYGGTDEVFINLGKVYREVLEGFHWGVVRTLEASGGIGEKNAQMKAWLLRNGGQK